PPASSVDFSVSHGRSSSPPRSRSSLGSSPHGSSGGEMKHLWGVLLIALSTPASPIASRPSDTPHFLSVTAAADHACALTDRGDAYCWGSNEFGQLGNGSSDSAPQLVPVRVRTDVRFTIVAAGFNHTCGLERDGSAW